MKKTGTARFISRPRRVSEIQENPGTPEENYRIVKTVTLRAIDYENFTEDLLIDRPFLDSYAALCRDSGDCLYVKRRGAAEGILVFPDQDRRLAAAALLRE